MCQQYEAERKLERWLEEKPMKTIKKSKAKTVKAWAVLHKGKITLDGLCNTSRNAVQCALMKDSSHVVIIRVEIREVSK